MRVFKPCLGYQGRLGREPGAWGEWEAPRAGWDRMWVRPLGTRASNLRLSPKLEPVENADS